MTAKLMKLSKVAEALDCSERCARELCERGELRGGKLGGQWRVHPDDLEAYVKKLRGLTKPAQVTKIEKADEESKKGASA